MLRSSFSRVRGRLNGTRTNVFAPTSGGFQPQSSNSTCLSPNGTACMPGSALRPVYVPTRIRRDLHLSSRPFIMSVANGLSLYSRSFASETSILVQRCIQQRFMSTKNSKGSDESKKPMATKTKEASEKAAEPGRLSSIVRSVGPTLRKVTEWNVGDLVSVYAIVLLIALIMFSPYVVEQMRKAESKYIELDEYDAVAQMEKIVRYELFGDEELLEEGASETSESDADSKKSVDNTINMAADVLQSEALQEAIASLITRVLESVQFQNACQTLLKNLWNDLVNDPETTAQIVQLLNNAIQNKEIQRSVRRLVLLLIKDKEVYDELTRLLVRLGQEPEVLDATRSLLTESAHNALNDPEILDHSMEFATDVVGDDIVQRTSGEALRNTVTYAAGPGVSVFLSILGVGLVWFAITAFGKSRATEQESAMVDKAVSSMARSIESGAREGVSTIASLPGRFLSLVTSILTFPFRIAEKGISGLGRTGEHVASSISNALYSIATLPGLIVRATMRQLERLGRSLSDRTSSTMSRIGAAISASFIGPILSSAGKMGRSLLSELSRIAEPVRHGISVSTKALVGPLSKLSDVTASVVSATRACVQATIATASRIVGNAAVRLSGLCSQSGSIIKSGIVVLVAKSEHAKEITMTVVTRVAGQCSTFVRSSIVWLTAKSEHSREVTATLFRQALVRCDAFIKSLAVKSAHAETVTMKLATDLGQNLKFAGERISSSIASALAWCIRIFRRDDRSDSSTTI